MTARKLFTLVVALLAVNSAFAQKISQLPSYPGPVTGQEQIPMSYLPLSTTQSYQITPQQIAAFTASGFYPITTAEIAHSCTPTNYFYQPGNVLRFGANQGGTLDVSAALICATSTASHVVMPSGQYLLNGTATVPLTNVEIECQGAPAGYNTPPSYGTAGATFWMTSTSVQPFALGTGVRFKNCNFFWPNQTGATSTPIAYPPLFTEQSGTQLNSFECISCRVINAYDFMDQASTSDAFGDISLVDTMGYAIRYWFQLANVPEFWKITNFHSDVGIYQGVAEAGPNYYLANWTAANGAFLHVFGNGNGTTVGSSVSVAGLNCSNCNLFAYNKAFWVDSTGAFAESKIQGIWDAIPHILEVDSGGCAADIEIDGPVYSYQAVFPSPGPGGTDNAVPFTFGTPPTSVCGTSKIRITGHLFTAQADVVDITGTGNKGFYVNLSGAGTYGNSSTAGTYYFAQVNSSTAIADFDGNHIEPKSGTAGSTRLGFNLTSCASCTLNGNSFNGVYTPITLGSSSVPVAGGGNIAINSPSGGLPISGTGNYAHQLLTGNSWDKYANPVVSSCGSGGAISDSTSTDISAVITVGTGTVTSCTATFANQWTGGPRCYPAGPQANGFMGAAVSATAVVVSSTNNMAGTTIWFHCDHGW